VTEQKAYSRPVEAHGAEVASAQRLELVPQAQALVDDRAVGADGRARAVTQLGAVAFKAAQASGEEAHRASFTSTRGLEASPQNHILPNLDRLGVEGRAAVV